MGDQWISSKDGVIQSAVEAAAAGRWSMGASYQDRPLTDDDKQAIIEQMAPEVLEDDDDDDDDERPDPPRIIGTPEEEAKIPEWVHGIEARSGHPLPAQND